MPVEYWYALNQIFGPERDFTVASAPYVQIGIHSTEKTLKCVP